MSPLLNPESILYRLQGYAGVINEAYGGLGLITCRCQQRC